MSPLIFIVDDNDSSGELISEIVQLAGLSNIKVFSDPFEALSAVRLGNLPALVISDFNMPGLDGVSLLDSISLLLPSCAGIIVTSDKQAALNRSDVFPVVDKASRNFIDELSGIIGAIANKYSID